MDGASASRGVPVYVPAFAGTHCAYPQRAGQAELCLCVCSLRCLQCTAENLTPYMSVVVVVVVLVVVVLVEYSLLPVTP